jgi:hypothetical protein
MPPVPPGWIRAAALVVGVGGAALADARPTGTPVADTFLTAALCVFVVGAGTRSRPAALVVASGVIGATGSPLAQVLALLAAALTIWCPDGRWAPVASASLAVACLHLDWPRAFGATAIVAAAVVVLLIATARPWYPRRTVAAVLAGACGLAVATLAGLGITAARHADDARLAVSLVRQGLDAARSGATVEADQRFSRAGALLTATHRDLHRWWVRPAVTVPVVAQHLRTADHLTGLAIEVVTAARRASRAADPGRLAVRGGSIDLTAVGGLEQPLLRLRNLVTDVPAELRPYRSPWLLRPVVEALDELEARAGEELPRVTTALEATKAATWLLGAGRERLYFVAVMTQSELRDGGGFVGNWGVLTARDGQLGLERFGRSDELEQLGPFEIDVNPEWNARYVDGWGVDRYFPRNSLSSPDLRMNAEAIRQAARQAGLGELDGVLAIDPFTMAALLRFTGPIEVAGWDAPLTADNAVETLMFEQYLRPDDPGRLDFLSNAATTLFERLTNMPLPEPARLAELLGPLARAGHLQLTAFDPTVSHFLHRAGTEPRLERPDDDSLDVTTAAASPTKLDWFLRRRYTYDVHTSSAGGVDATLEVTLENVAPPDLPGGYFGPSAHTGRSENRVLLSVYTPLRAQATTLDGVSVELAGAEEAGHHVHELLVTLPPGSRRTVVMTLAGSLPRPAYTLDLLHQPTSTPDRVRVVVDGTVRFDGALVAPTRLDGP